MKAVLVVLFICTTVSAQSREELRSKYGPPVSETFTAKPGVFVTVSYTATGEVCQMIIHPQQLTTNLDYPITKTMESRNLASIIDEVVPVTQRGKRLMGTFINLMCLPLNNCQGVMEDYE